MLNFWRIGVFISSLFISIALPMAVMAQTHTYTYDALGRLTIVSHDSADDRLYEYDKAGNRTKITVYENNGSTGGGSGGGGGSSNNAPTCSDFSLTLPASQTYAFADPITGHCTDSDGDTMTLTNVTPPINGASATVNYGLVILSNLPVGATTVTFTVIDGNGGTDSAALTVIRPYGGGGGGWPMCGNVPC